jgi:hypothetical protein
VEQIVLISNFYAVEVIGMKRFSDRLKLSHGYLLTGPDRDRLKKVSKFSGSKCGHGSGLRLRFKAWAEVDRVEPVVNNLNKGRLDVISNIDGTVSTLKMTAMDWRLTVECCASRDRYRVRFVVKQAVLVCNFYVIEVIGMKRFSNRLKLSHGYEFMGQIGTNWKNRVHSDRGIVLER